MRELRYTLVTMKTGKEITVKQFKVPAELHSRLRILAIEKGKLMPILLREIVEEYVARETKGRKR